MAYSTKGFLHKFLPDIWIYTDATKQSTPGFGISLFAETNTGCVYSGEAFRGEACEEFDTEVPEDLGSLCAARLMEEIKFQGAVDTSSIWIILILMALGKTTSRIKVGRLTTFIIYCIRNIFAIYGVTFNIQTVEQFQELNKQSLFESTNQPGFILSCTGIGYENLARKVE